jgi:hypothetical protein
MGVMERMFREAMGLAAKGDAGGTETVPLEAPVPQAQPHKRFEGLEALAESIREKGVLLSEDLGKTREEVVGLLHRMRNEKGGKATHNVMGSPEARRVEEVFKALGRMTWESFVQNRLPLLSSPRT